VDKAGRKRTGNETPLNMLNLFCQQPRQWKAYAAKAISDRLSARTVCDSSGGWGDRLTGFLAASSVEKITVIEPRRAACDAFKRQLEDAGVDKDLTVLNGPAEVMMEDVAGDIDLFLTSPPYLPSERYPGEDGGQVHQTVARGEIQQYLDSFLLPVLRAQAARLSATGAMIVNIADVNGKRVCQPMLDAMQECDDLAFAGTMLLAMSSGVLEPMYVWCRPGHRDELRRLLTPDAAADSDADPAGPADDSALSPVGGRSSTPARLCKTNAPTRLQKRILKRTEQKKRKKKRKLTAHKKTVAKATNRRRKTGFVPVMLGSKQTGGLRDCMHDAEQIIDQQ